MDRRKYSPYQIIALCICLAIIILFIILVPGKITKARIMIYLRQAAVISFAITGSGIIYLTGCLNLSSGGQVYLGNVLLGLCLYSWGLSLPLSIGFLLLFSTVLGFVYMFLRDKLGMELVYFTLAFQVILTGLGNMLLSDSLKGSSTLFSSEISIPFSLWLFIWISILLILLLGGHYTTLGRTLFIARSIRLMPGRESIYRRVTNIAIILGCVLISISSIVLFLKMGRNPASISNNYTYDILAGMFLGGVGGRQSKTFILNVIAGSIAVVLLNAILLFIGISMYWEILLKALIILNGFYFSEKPVI